MFRSRVRSIRPFFDHLAVAVVLASVVLVAEHHGYLNWLTSASLRLAAAIAPATLSDMAGQRNADEPVVLVVSSVIFETVFQQNSPLDRAIISNILGNIAAGKPRLIAVDLDLSP